MYNVLMKHLVASEPPKTPSKGSLMSGLSAFGGGLKKSTAHLIASAATATGGHHHHHSSGSADKIDLSELLDTPIEIDPVSR